MGPTSWSSGGRPKIIKAGPSSYSNRSSWVAGFGRTEASSPRDQETPRRPDTPDSFIPGQTLRDWGFYAQLLWGFNPRWALGVRGEYASGGGNDISFDPATETAQSVRRNTDPFRDNRYRLSPVLVFHPSEFSRLRLQYNHDWAAHLPGRTADTVWVGAEFLYGAHPAHKY